MPHEQKFITLLPTWSGLRRDTDGWAIGSPRDDYLIIAENLMPFRTAVRNASEVERRRFLAIIAPKPTGFVAEAV